MYDLCGFDRGHADVGVTCGRIDAVGCVVLADVFWSRLRQ